MIEHPMEARVISWNREGASSRTLGVAPAFAAASLDTAAWARGRNEDHEWTFDLAHPLL